MKLLITDATNPLYPLFKTGTLLRPCCRQIHQVWWRSKDCNCRRIYFSTFHSPRATLHENAAIYHHGICRASSCDYISSDKVWDPSIFDNDVDPNDTSFFSTNPEQHQLLPHDDYNIQGEYIKAHNTDIASTERDPTVDAGIPILQSLAQ